MDRRPCRRVIDSWLVVTFSCWILSCSPDARSVVRSGEEDSIFVHDKQKGAHVFGELDSTNFEFLTRNHIEWITLVPWGFQTEIGSSKVTHHNGDSLQIRRYNEFWINRIKKIKAAGFKVFVKPHIWIDKPADGKWRSDIYSSAEDWEQWKETYSEFILRYAQVAEFAQADMFCVGTELARLSLDKPEFWQKLIKEARGVYSGQITYAANWYQEFERITFWKDLDFIGVQAYFPLVDQEYPSISQVAKGWDLHLQMLEKIHEKFDRPILFTEMGYKSTSDAAMRPWEWVDHAPLDSKTISFETQSNCYEAFFQKVWPKQWFAGVHIWQLRSDHYEIKDEMGIDFTPQDKPAEQVIADGFADDPAILTY